MKEFFQAYCHTWKSFTSLGWKHETIVAVQCVQIIFTTWCKRNSFIHCICFFHSYIPTRVAVKVMLHGQPLWILLCSGNKVLINSVRRGKQQQQSHWVIQHIKSNLTSLVEIIYVCVCMYVCICQSSACVPVGVCMCMCGLHSKWLVLTGNERTTNVNSVKVLCRLLPV